MSQPQSLLSREVKRLLLLWSREQNRDTTPLKPTKKEEYKRSVEKGAATLEDCPYARSGSPENHHTPTRAARRAVKGCRSIEEL